MKYDGILICSDFDGTLVGKDKIVSEETKDAIRMFQSNGGKFTMATGRMPWYLAEKLHGVRLDAPIVTANGAALFDTQTKKTIFDIQIHSVNKQLVQNVFQLPECIGFNSIATDFKMTSIRKDQHHTLNDAISAVDNPLYKIVFIFDNTEIPPNVCNSLRKSYGNKYFFSRSCPTFVELLDKDANKGAMAVKLREYLGCVDTLVGVGDFDNDIPLIKYADIGYAVEDAQQCVKDSADRITVDSEHSPIAKIIYEL